MVQALQLFAVLCATLFAGAALYISVVEHPARLTLETRAAVNQWAPSYARATWLQAPLALLSFVSGAAAWFVSAGAGWLVAALLIGVVVPFTFVVVMPTNHELLAPGRDLDAAETRMLLRRWGNFHAVRTMLSLASTALYFWLLRDL
jgi:anthrone oxygenase-like protein